MDNALKSLNSKEKETIKELGEHMGWGRIMQLAEECWREHAEKKNLTGSELTVGTCSAFLVPCQHPIKDAHGHCDICCGSDRITKGVLSILEKSTVLIGALEQAAKTFRQYEKNHMQKTPPDQVKAWRNRDEAEMCENAIKSYNHQDAESYYIKGPTSYE